MKLSSTVLLRIIDMSNRRQKKGLVYSEKGHFKYQYQQYDHDYYAPVVAVFSIEIESPYQFIEKCMLGYTFCRQGTPISASILNQPLMLQLRY